MYLACEWCNESLMDELDAPSEHVCDQALLRQRVEFLEKNARESQNSLSKIRGQLLKTFADHAEEIVESTHPHMGLLRKLWNAGECRFYESVDIEEFSADWMRTHIIMCHALRLFQKAANEHRTNSAMGVLETLYTFCGQYVNRMEPERKNWRWQERTPELIRAELSANRELTQPQRAKAEHRVRRTVRGQTVPRDDPAELCERAVQGVDLRQNRRMELVMSDGYQRRPEERPYTDGEALEIADDVAFKIIDDYKGMVIGGEKCGLSTDQLFIRIRRGLMAFHHREAHFEGTVSGTRPAEQRPEVKSQSRFWIAVSFLMLVFNYITLAMLFDANFKLAEANRQLDYWTCRVQLEPMPMPEPTGPGPTLVEESQ